MNYLLSYKHLLRLVITVFLVVAAKSSFAQALWQGSVYGMSPEEVQRVLPGVKRVRDDIGLYGGAQELLRLDDAELIGKRFRVRFYFLKQKLIQTTISLMDPPTAFNDMLYVFNDMAGFLRSKYGPELSIRRKDFGVFGSVARADWMSEETRIILLVNSMGGSPALDLIYQVHPPGVDPRPIIIFKGGSGQAIVDKVWEEGDQVCWESKGTRMCRPRERIERITPEILVQPQQPGQRPSPIQKP